MFWSKLVGAFSLALQVVGCSSFHYYEAQDDNVGRFIGNPCPCPNNAIEFPAGSMGASLYLSVMPAHMCSNATTLFITISDVPVTGVQLGGGKPPAQRVHHEITFPDGAEVTLKTSDGVEVRRPVTRIVNVMDGSQAAIFTVRIADDQPDFVEISTPALLVDGQRIESKKIKFALRTGSVVMC